MKYNIVTAANASYFAFLDILINSARKNSADLDRIFVIDSGLGEFKSRVAADIIDMQATDAYTGVHSDGWRQATRTKTLGLLKLLETYDSDTPLILIDSDVCVVKDLGTILDRDYDIQATVMSDGGHRRRDGIFIKEIACFVAFNRPRQAMEFVRQWSANIKLLEDNKIDAPHETPAFNFALADFSDRLRIGRLDENLVCADLKHFDMTYSVHFKSNGGTKLTPAENFTSRVNAVRQYTAEFTNYYQYQNPEHYKHWLSTMEKQ
jgi:hypothetical protein